MIHPDTQVHFINEEKGYGLVAVRTLPRGTITWTLDPLDKQISPAEMAGYEERFRDILLKYSFRNNRGNYIFCWDNGRYINHSFDSNCCLTPYNFEIAIRDIAPGEELTDDYGYLNIIEPFEAQPEGGQRTVVHPDDLLRYSGMWDANIAAAFPDIIRVEQALKNYLPEGIWKTIEDIERGKRKLESIRSCYFDNN